MLEKAGEDRLRHATEGKVEGRTEVTERPDPALKKIRALQLKIFFFFKRLIAQTKNLYIKSERLTFSCRVTWALSERVNLYN